MFFQKIFELMKNVFPSNYNIFINLHFAYQKTIEPSFVFQNANLL